MKFLKITIFFFALFFLVPASAHGHGLGLDTISSVRIQDKEISITVELPMYFDSVDEKQITITAIDEETDENAKNVQKMVTFLSK